MWPTAVVVVLVLAEHRFGVLLVDDQGAIEEFASGAADEAFGNRDGPRCLHRCLDDADVGGGEDRVARGGELGGAVPKEVIDAAAGVVEEELGPRRSGSAGRGVDAGVVQD